MLCLAGSVLLFFPSVRAVAGTLTILPNGSIDPSNGRIVTLDNRTYIITTDLSDAIVIQRSNITVDGNGHLLNSSSTSAFAFDLLGVSSVTIRNARITGYGRGVFLESSSNDNIIVGNNITSVNGIGIWIDANSNHNNLTHNYIANTGEGIRVSQSNYNLIARNTVTSNNGAGIDLAAANNNTLASNVVNNNYNWGISITEGSNRNNVTENEVSANTGSGIDIAYSSYYNYVARNNVSFSRGGDYGLGMALSGGSNYNVIEENNVASNEAGGIKLGGVADNTIAGNIIAKSKQGLRLDTANNNTIFGNNIVKNTVIGIFLAYSSNNTIYHNNFAWNAIQAGTDTSFGTWDDDYPPGGNYWRNYNGTDSDHDGIGDTPYVIDASNIDRYPLMNSIGVVPYLDTKPPIISVISPENKTYTQEQVQLNFTLNELTTWLGYSLDGQANVTVAGNLTLTDFSEGTHSVRVYARDLDENVGLSETVHFTLDTIAPSISILSPENETYGASGIPLNFTVSETTSWIAYSLDGNANVTISGNTILVGLSEGVHYLVIYAKDLENVGSSSVVHFTKDTIAPMITVLTPLNETYDASDVPLSVFVSETTSWMGYSLDGHAKKTFTEDENVTLTELSDGGHNITLYAKDMVGNVGTSATVFFTISQKSEPLPITWIAAAVIAVVAVIVVAVIVLKKRPKQRA